MSAHTPGPWVYAWTGNRALVFPKGGATIAGIPYDGDNEIPQAEANARLIAASPDLLKALTDLVANQDATWTASGFTDEQIKAMPYLKPARDAITKATNQPS